MSPVVGRIDEVRVTPTGREGMVSVRGARLAVALDAVPDAERGDFVLVEAGVALSRLTDDEDEGDPQAAHACDARSAIHSREGA